MSPDAQCVFSSGPSIIIVASVLHNQTEVKRTGKVNSELDLSDIGGFNRVKRVSALSAAASGSGCVCALQTSLSFVCWIENRTWIRVT